MTDAESWSDYSYGRIRTAWTSKSTRVQAKTMKRGLRLDQLTTRKWSLKLITPCSSVVTCTLDWSTKVPSRTSWSAVLLLTLLLLLISMLLLCLRFNVSLSTFTKKTVDPDSIEKDDRFSEKFRIEIHFRDICQVCKPSEHYEKLCT